MVPKEEPVTPEEPPAKKLRRRSQPEEALTPMTEVIPLVSSQPPLDILAPVDDNKVFIGDVEVVIENGKFICPVKICAKHFRRENLLHVSSMTIYNFMFYDFDNFFCSCGT